MRSASAGPATTILQKIALLLLGIFFSVVFLEAGLRAGGLAISSWQQHQNRLSLREKGDYRILCLGESTTAGQYPQFLEQALDRYNLGVRFSVIDQGVVGTNTSCILEKLESALETFRPDLVVTMMGINDEGTHLPYDGTSVSRAVHFFRSLRVYKLARYLGMHAAEKAQRKDRETTGTETVKQELPERPRPANAENYFDLGLNHRIRGRFYEAEEAFKKVIALRPEHGGAHLELGGICAEQGRFDEAEGFLEKAIALDPKNSRGYLELGEFYTMCERPLEAEGMYAKALELAAINKTYEENGRDYIALGKAYLDQGKFSEAERLYQQALDRDPQKYRLYGALQLMYFEKGDMELAEEWNARARAAGYYPPATAANYRAVREILKDRGIAYVCVQYPMRSVGPLKDIFKDDPRGVVFVDNERLFKDAVIREKYGTYFRDRFAGDFGHCTEKGNKLLAENIAKVIAEEVF